VLDVPVKRVGGSSRQIRGVINLEARDHASSKRRKLLIPRSQEKPLSIKLHGDRTVIGHTWAG
jgi:hypothetical protein